MTDILLISDSLPNINVAWRHFCQGEYNANATVNVEAAMEAIRSDKPPQVVVYYCSADNSRKFFSFYRIFRAEKKAAGCPLVVLADVELQKALSEYVKLENTDVLGISVNDDVLLSLIRDAASRDA